MSDYTECPACGSPDVYQDKCDNFDCDGFGGLFTWCNHCEWQEHYCEDGVWWED